MNTSNYLKSVFLMCVVMAFYAVTEIWAHQVKTWLPWWIYTDHSWFGLPEVWPWTIVDAYHIIKGACLASLYVLGLTIHGSQMITQDWRGVTGLEILKWLMAYISFDLFYHVILPLEISKPFLLRIFL